VWLARSQGVVAVLDMPNTDPPITGPEKAEERLMTARGEGVEDGYYVYVAATPSEGQLEEAVEAAKRIRRVAGLKMYTAPMRGLEAPRREDQLLVYKRLAELGYRGVLAVHAERMDLLREDLWDPLKPWTWGLARPPEAEVASVRDQLALAEETGFAGVLYLVHVSVPESIELVREARESGVRVVCGVTPHHLMLSLDDMRRPWGAALKVNPPLRERRTVNSLLELVRAGEVDFLETDHAPHSAWEKYGPPYLSGLPCLWIYSRCVEWLLSQSVPERVVRDMTYHNIKRVFRNIEE